VPGAVAVHGLAFSSTGELFAADIYSSRVYRFTFDSSGGAVPNGFIDAPGGSLGVAFSGEGELFVSLHFSGGIARFLFDSSGGAAPNGFIPTPNMGGLSVFTRSCAQPGVGSLAGVTADADASTCSAAVNVATPAATDDCGAVNVVGSRSDGQPLSAPYPVGTTTITWTASDGAGNTSTATQTVTVRDTQAPSVAGVAASPASMWPPNHSMQNVTVSYNASDACGAVNCVITSVTSNEPVNGAGDGDTAPDWLVTDAHHVQLRAERAGNGSGRVYTITVACTDSAGNTTTKAVAVTVSKSQGK
jgi:hypothetical protein